MSKVIKVSAVLTVLAAALVGPAQAELADTKFYSNQTPYGNAATSPYVTPASDDYKMFFIETIARHGSRSNTSTSAETRALNVWKTARSRNALTLAGKKFEADLLAFQKAERAVGYGLLSNLGKAEMAGIGRRTAVNYADFFNNTKVAGERIALVKTTFFRTLQSATALKAGLDGAVPELRYASTTTDAARLELTSGSTALGRAAIVKSKKFSAVRTAANNVLRRMYTQKYIDSLTNPVAAAQDVYLLYCTGAAMRGHTTVTFARYFSLSDARMLGYVKDAENFYSFGPGVATQTYSYRKAQPLLDDFFARLDKRIGGDNVAAVFRLGHGETTMPFAALIKAPYSQVQAPVGGVYTYSNPWRGYIAGRPGGNVEWVAYKNSAGNVLVTMRYNEAPVAFRASCTPVEPYFYTVAELKSCLL